VYLSASRAGCTSQANCGINGIIILLFKAGQNTVFAYVRWDLRVAYRGTAGVSKAFQPSFFKVFNKIKFLGTETVVNALRHITWG
jgi:hypothetical protein